MVEALGERGFYRHFTSRLAHCTTFNVNMGSWVSTLLDWHLLGLCSSVSYGRSNAVCITVLRTVFR